MVSFTLVSKKGNKKIETLSWSEGTINPNDPLIIQFNVYSTPFEIRISYTGIAERGII